MNQIIQYQSNKYILALSPLAEVKFGMQCSVLTALEMLLMEKVHMTKDLYLSLATIALILRARSARVW